MGAQEDMELRLWDYIDGTSNPAETSAVAELIAVHAAWQQKYSELLEVNQLMSGVELESPSMRFTRNVMEDISKYTVAPATRSYINNKIIWGIGGFFVIMIVGFLAYAFSQVSWSSQGSSDILSQYHLDKKIDWSRFFSSTYTNVFLMINVILGLVLLDMVLQRKKETTKKFPADIADQRRNK